MVSAGPLPLGFGRWRASQPVSVSSGWEESATPKITLWKNTSEMRKSVNRFFTFHFVFFYSPLWLSGLLSVFDFLLLKSLSKGSGISSMSCLLAVFFSVVGFPSPASFLQEKDGCLYILKPQVAFLNESTGLLVKVQQNQLL